MLNGVPDIFTAYSNDDKNSFARESDLDDFFFSIESHEMERRLDSFLLGFQRKQQENEIIWEMSPV